MEKKTLNSLFADNLYRIPDYQRGYAWEDTQIKDFVSDIDAIIDDDLKSHYTGTIVVYEPDNSEQKYGTKRLNTLDVVDGQQRLTTACLYLSVILNNLVKLDASEYEMEIVHFLFAGTSNKLSLSNDTDNLFYDLLKQGRSNTPPRSTHEHRLIEAHAILNNHIVKKIGGGSNSAIKTLEDLFHTITQKLHFTFYAIEEECEIGMTFELMNSRGKGLSVLELLKNYLMYWVSRNVSDIIKKQDMTDLIHKNWKDTYINLGDSGGSEDQCLRIAWTLYCSHTPKNWLGYKGFKAEEYIPLRNFTKKSKQETQAFIEKFVEGMTEISRHYVVTTKPDSSNCLNRLEQKWLEKIHRTGNIANFLPLMTAARIHLENKKLNIEQYIELLRALECYAYRVFLFAGKRSNAGKSSLNIYADQLFREASEIESVITNVHALIRYYAPELDFIGILGTQSNWYSTRHRLKYTLFEYELYLLSEKGHAKQPRLKWESLSDTTIEHILPQTPEDDSQWKKDWSAEEFDNALHDIGNLVLTLDNSSYSNFEFERKKGKVGISPSYANSDIRQEREIASYPVWTSIEYFERSESLCSWVKERWKSTPAQLTISDNIVDEHDEDADMNDLVATKEWSMANG